MTRKRPTYNFLSGEDPIAGIAFRSLVLFAVSPDLYTSRDQLVNSLAGSLGVNLSEVDLHQVRSEMIGMLACGNCYNAYHAKMIVDDVFLLLQEGVL